MAELGAPPLIVVCLRVTDSAPRVAALTGETHRDQQAATADPAELAALEHALRIAETIHGRVLVLVTAPKRTESFVREIMAFNSATLRVDVLRLDADQPYADELIADERALAAALVAAMRAVAEPALVICGDRSSDRGTGAVPAFIAAGLAAKQALGLVSLTVDSDATVTAERRLDGGRREQLKTRIGHGPVVCSVEAAGVRLRRAPLAAVLRTAAAPVPTAAIGLTIAGTAGQARPRRPRPRVISAPTGTALERLAALTGVLQAHEPPTVIGPVDAVQAADAVLDYLRRHGYIDEASVARAAARP